MTKLSGLHLEQARISTSSPCLTPQLAHAVGFFRRPPLAVVTYSPSFIWGWPESSRARSHRASLSIIANIPPLSSGRGTHDSKILEMSSGRSMGDSGSSSSGNNSDSSPSKNSLDFNGLKIEGWWSLTVHCLAHQNTKSLPLSACDLLVEMNCRSARKDMYTVAMYTASSNTSRKDR